MADKPIKQAEAKAVKAEAPAVEAAPAKVEKAEAETVEAKAAPEAKPEPQPEPAPAPAAEVKAEPTPAAAPVKAPLPAKAAKPVRRPRKAAKIAEPARKPARKTQVKPIAVPAAAKVAAPAAPAAPRPSIKELKEKIMASKPTIDTEMMTESVSAAFAEMQEKAKAAYEKGTAAMSDMTDFAKGNVEALVESGKILAGGVQDLSKVAVEEAKSAYEVATADLKEMAAVKSPTELFQLQGRIARRNFDAMVATTSKNTEAMMKLASDVFAPLSGRVNIAVEKISKAA